MWRASRDGAVWLAASSAALDVTVENSRSLVLASAADEATSVVPVAAARCRMIGPKCAASALMSNAWS